MLLVSLSMMAVDYLVIAVAGSIWLLLLARIVGGITAATHATASAYMADLSKPGEKAANFGLIGAGFGIGFVLGPLIGGLLGELGTRAPFYAAAGLALLNTGIGALVLSLAGKVAMRTALKLGAVPSSPPPTAPRRHRTGTRLTHSMGYHDGL